MATITKKDMLNPNQRWIPALEEQASQRRKRSSLVMAVSLVVTVVVTALAFLLVRSQENVAMAARFHLDSADHVRALQQEIKLNMELMQSLVSFFAASKRVEHDEFERFLRAPVGGHPWVQSLQWAPLVSHAERARFELAVREARSLDFQITEQAARGEMVRAGDRGEYCPVTYLVPFQSNIRAYGFDLLSEPDRRQALSQARETGEIRASAGVTLVQGERGFLLVAPVYQTSPAPATRELRRAATAGFCVGVFRIRAVLEHALEFVRHDGVALALFEVTDTGEPALLEYQSVDARSRAPSAEALTRPRGLQHRDRLDVAGRSWLIVSTPARSYQATSSRWQSWSALGGGAALTAFLAFSFLQHRRYSESLEDRVTRRTQDLALAYSGLEGEMKIRSRAEKALRQSQEQLQAILNNTTAVVYLKDREGRYLLVNQRYKSLFDVSDDGIIGRTDYDIFPAEVADAVRANDLKVLAAEAPLEMEEVVPRKGEPRTYISIKFPLRGEQGSAYAVCGISTDITERKRMEEALQASQQRYDLIITGINDGIWDWNLATNEVYFSPHWKSMLGYGEDEVENTFSGWQELLHPDDAERANSPSGLFSKAPARCMNWSTGSATATAPTAGFWPVASPCGMRMGGPCDWRVPTSI